MVVRRGRLFLIYCNSEVVAIRGYPTQGKSLSLFTVLLWVFSLLSYSGLGICIFLASLLMSLRFFYILDFDFFVGVRVSLSTYSTIFLEQHSLLNAIDFARLLSREMQTKVVMR